MTISSTNYFIRRFSDRFISRWLVLAVDISVVVFCIFFATLIRRNFRISDIDLDLLRFNFFLILSTRIVFFFLFKSYEGIIRHTSMEDALKIFKTIFLSSLFILAISWGYKFQFETLNFISNALAVYIIDFFLTLVFLIGIRIFAKAFYEFFNVNNLPVSNVLIFGAGYSGLLTKNIISADSRSNYAVLGFIDENETKINKSLEGIRVYNLEQAIERFVGHYRNLSVIIAVNNLSKEKRRYVSDLFLEKGIVVKNLPPMNKWVDGGFSLNQIHNVKIEDLLGREVIQTNNSSISSEINSKTIFVTGAAGSIGSELVRQLIQYLPNKLILIDQSETGIYDLEFELKGQIPQNVNVNFIVGSVTDKIRMAKIFKKYKPDIVFHAAAYKHVPLMENNPYEAIRVNVLGTRLMADLAIESGVKKFVMVSTDKAVNPTNVMGATKRLAEMYTQSMNQLEDGKTKFIATRFGNVLGSNGSVIPLFKKQIENGGPLTVTHPEITRYFMTIPEACQLVLEAATMGVGGEVFVFDMGEPVKIVDLAKKMITLSGLTIDKDIKLHFSGLRPGEKLYEELLSNNENTLPTHHPKILIAKLNTPSFAFMEIQLNDIQTILEMGTNTHLVAKIKEIIPEYLSNNSVFEQLDKSTILRK
ncbi:polysaccharide biosynthesis protein [Sandaracinomonas limnophila]|uniref:Polysaccharide biosynthesis protein n=1 Tax=Sandaracinomonas limnophila TaxID=1862386 RepID=A0A437PUB1_9BACT|nr:nucleoside-diphosphate sugar epimerase/dehydratase [Sandaracinomonas limnophila]RVU25836.1 polysaccharide biosynthesis protein [Sandaracinomonas limnophila]